MTFPRTKLKDLLFAIGDLGGVALDSQITPEQQAAMIRLVREKTGEVMEEYQWPALTATEQRHYRPAWDSAATYAAGDQVWKANAADGDDPAATEIYYEALGASTNSDPETNADDWQPISGTAGALQDPALEPMELYVELQDLIGTEAAGVPAAELGRIFHVWDSNPDRNEFATEIQGWELRGGRIQLPLDLGLSSVWVEYQVPAPALEPKPWDEDETVLAGAVRYVDGALHDAEEIGDCYRAREVTTGEFPPLSDEWELIPFPAVLAATVKYLVSADRLRADGKEDTAKAREASADKALARATNNIGMQQQQSARWSAMRAGPRP